MNERRRRRSVERLENAGSSGSRSGSDTLCDCDERDVWLPSSPDCSTVQPDKSTTPRIRKSSWKFQKRDRASIQSLSYPERLKHVNLDILELRRLYTDLCYCYKMLFGLVDVQVADFFEWTPHHSTRGHNFKLYKKRCTMRVRSTFLVSVLSMSGITYPPV